MKRFLSIGFIIVGVATSLLWGVMTIVHFFYFAPDYEPQELYTAFVEVMNWATTNPDVLITIGILGLCTVAYQFAKKWIPESKANTIVANILITAFMTSVCWLVVGIVISLVSGKFSLADIPQKGFGAISLHALLSSGDKSYVFTNEARYYIRMFFPVMQLTVVNYALTFAFFIIAGMFGRAFLMRLWKGMEFPSLLQEFLFSTATGLGLLGLLIFIFGLLHLIYPWMVALIIFGAILFGLESAPDYLRRLWAGIKAIRLPMLPAVLFVVLLIIIASSLHTPLFPVHMHDAMNSHLEAPKVFIRDHAVKFHAYINFNNFPMGIDMIYIPFLMLGRPIMSQICTFFFFLLCLGVIYEFSRTFFNSPTTGILAVILLCLVPRFVGQFNHPTVDIGLTFYLTLILLAVAGWLYGKYKNYLQLSGVILGLSLGIKYTGLPYVVLIVFWILIQHLLLQNSPFKQTMKQIGLMILIAIILCCPWYVRNIVLFGNPFFPFYNEFFSNILPIGTAKEQKPYLTIDEKKMLKEFEYEGDWRRGYRFLADLSITGSAGAMQNQFGPLFFAIIPILIIPLLTGLGKLFGRYVLQRDIKISINFPVWMLVFSVFVYVIYWVFYVGILHTRYMYPIIPILAILAAYSLNSLFRLNEVNGRHILAIFLATVFGMLSIYYFQNGVLRWEVNELPLIENSREVFLKRQISSFDAVTSINENEELNLGPDDIVYGLFCENCRFYADFTLIGGLFGYADHRTFNSHTSSGRELYEYLKSFGCSYLLVDKRRMQVLSGRYEDIKLPTDPTFNKHFTLIKSYGTTNFYSIID